jgi:SLOG in TRPM, prokaryote
MQTPPLPTVIEPFQIPLPGGGSATAVELEHPEELEAAPSALALNGAEASLVVIGGADGMSKRDLRRLTPLFSGVLAELAWRLLVVVLDGGTDTGVMRLMGRGRAESGRDFPLVGVVASALVAVPGRPPSPEVAELEPNHTHFVLVPGDNWGDEGPWLARLGGMFGDGKRSATLLVNGGEISRHDAELSVAAGRPVIVLAGSGRTADALASAAEGRPPDERSERIVATGLVRSVDLRDRDGLSWMLDDVFQGRE